MRSIRSGQLNRRTSPPLYFVKMDIKAAFDTLNQEKLLAVAAQVLRRVSVYLVTPWFNSMTGTIQCRTETMWLESTCKCCLCLVELHCCGRNTLVQNASRHLDAFRPNTYRPPSFSLVQELLSRITRVRSEATKRNIYRSSRCHFPVQAKHTSRLV